MATLAERARTAHRRQIALAAKETVTFVRGTAEVTITEAIGNEVTYEIMGDDGLMSQVTSQDWLLPQDQVLINGAAVEPQLNDKIVSDGKTYKPFKMTPATEAVEPHCGDEFWLVHTHKWVQ